MTIFRTARYELQAEAIEACKAVIQETIAFAKEHEPGTLMYLVLQDAENPTKFLHISAYSDEEALQKHITGEPMVTNIRNVMAPAFVGEVTFTHYRVVDAKVDHSLISE